MQPTPYIAKTIVNAQDAIASHIRWRITLLLATTVREPLTERAMLSIRYPAECSLGKWLLSDRMQHLRNTPEYHTVDELHHAFHEQMRRVADLINAGEFEEAQRLLNAPEPFQSTSNAFANSITALDRCSAARVAS